MWLWSTSFAGFLNAGTVLPSSVLLTERCLCCCRCGGVVFFWIFKGAGYALLSSSTIWCVGRAARGGGAGARALPSLAFASALSRILSALLLLVAKRFFWRFDSTFSASRRACLTCASDFLRACGLGGTRGAFLGFSHLSAL